MGSEARVGLIVVGVSMGACSLLTNLDDLGGALDAPNDANEAALPEAGEASSSDSASDGGNVDPLSLAAAGQLALWLEASASSLFLSQGHVTGWQDRSGKHNDATSTSNGPVVDLGVVNGLDAVHIGAHGQVLTIADSASLQFATDPFLVMTVARQKQTDVLFLFSKASAANQGAGSMFATGFEFFGASSTVDGGAGPFLFPFADMVPASGGPPTLHVKWNAPVFDDGKFHIVGFERSNATTVALIVDDQPPVSATSAAIDVSQIGHNASLGSIPYGNIAPPADADIAEIIVVHSGSIDDAVVAGLHDYLKVKYAL